MKASRTKPSRITRGSGDDEDDVGDRDAHGAKLGGHAADRLDRALFSQHVRLRTLEQQLYHHVLEAIDFDVLRGLEQSLFEILVGRMNVGGDLALDLSALFVQRALVRAADDDARFFDCGPPPGITEAERKAVKLDANCPFCRIAAKAAEDERRRRELHGPAADHVDDEEACACCEMLAEEWREEHRAILENAGLAKPRAGTGPQAGLGPDVS